MAEIVQAAATVVSFIVAVVAAWVAWVAKGVAEASNVIAADARDAEKEQARIANEALLAARRQTELSAVPNVVATNPRILQASGNRPQRLQVDIHNAGPTVAYGLIVSAAAAIDRNLDTVDDSTRGASRRDPGLPPGKDHQTLSAPVDTLSEWMAVSVECFSPLGTLVRHDYLWGRPSGKWRLHRVTMTPETGPPLIFNLGLGWFDEADPDADPEGKPPVFGGAA